MPERKELSQVEASGPCPGVTINNPDVIKDLWWGGTSRWEERGMDATEGPGPMTPTALGLGFGATQRGPEAMTSSGDTRMWGSPKISPTCSPWATSPAATAIMKMPTDLDRPWGEAGNPNWSPYVQKRLGFRA